MSIPPASSSNPLGDAVCMRTDADVYNILQAYNKDQDRQAIVRALFIAMGTVPDGSALEAFCRNIVQRCPRYLVDDLIAYVPDVRVLLGGEYYNLGQVFRAVVLDVESARRVVAAAPPSSTTTAPSASKSDSQAISPPSSSNPLGDAVYMKTDADMVVVLQAYIKDPCATVGAIYVAMGTVPDESALTAFCRNMAQRCPRHIIAEVTAYFCAASIVIGGKRYNIHEVLDAVVREGEDARRAAVAASPSTRTPTPSASKSDSQEVSVVVPVKIGVGLSMDMEALGCPRSVMECHSCGPNSASYVLATETSAMTDLEKQFVTDPVLVHFARNNVSLATLYMYLKHHYPALVKDRSESDMMNFWGRRIAEPYPLRVKALSKDKSYVRHVVTNSGSCPSSGGFYFFKEAPLPDPVVRF